MITFSYIELYNFNLKGFDMRITESMLRKEIRKVLREGLSALDNRQSDPPPRLPESIQTLEEVLEYIKWAHQYAGMNRMHIQNNAMEIQKMQRTLPEESDY